MQARRRPIRAQLIDAMGTLVRLADPVPRLRAGLRDDLGLEIAASRVQHALAAEIRCYRAHMHEGRDPRSIAALRRRCTLALRDGLGDSVPPGVADAALERVLLGALAFEAFPDAAPALARARERGEVVVVVSNWDASLPQALASAGLHADAVVSSAAAGVAKPGPAIFAAALALAGAQPDEARHVGDSLAEDVAGAAAAGIEALWLNREGRPVPDGVRAIASLDDI